MLTQEGFLQDGTRFSEFMRMIRPCRQGKIDMILTKSVTRVARSTVDCMNYMRELRSLGILVIFEKEGLNTMHKDFSSQQHF